MAEDKEAKHGGHKNGRRGGISGGSFFTWFMVIALLGVWTSVAVVWFDLVDYEEVLGKLGVYDADGDGDFDVDDAKVLLEGPGGLAKRKTKAKEPTKEELKKEREKAVPSKTEEGRRGKKEREDGRKEKKKSDSDISQKASPGGLKERSTSERTFPPEEAETQAELEEQAPEGAEAQNVEDEVKEQIQSLLQESVHTDHDLEADGPAGEPQSEVEDFLTATDSDDRFEALEPGTVHEDTEDSYHVEETASQNHPNDAEEVMSEQESSDHGEAVTDNGLQQHAEEVRHEDYDEPDTDGSGMRRGEECHLLKKSEVEEAGQRQSGRGKLSAPEYMNLQKMKE